MFGKNKKDKYIYILAVGLVLIVLIPLLYLIAVELNLFGLGSDDYELEEDLTTPEVLQVENNKEIDNVVLPESFVIISNLVGTPEGYVCQSTSENLCTIQIVTDGTNTFYISNPSVVVFNGGASAKTETTTTMVAGQEEAFTYERLELENEVDTVVKQIYGCIEENTCISSGLLDINTEANSNQVAKFESFLKNITLK